MSDLLDPWSVTRDDPDCSIHHSWVQIITLEGEERYWVCVGCGEEEQEDPT